MLDGILTRKRPFRQTRNLNGAGLLTNPSVVDDNYDNVHTRRTGFGTYGNLARMEQI